VAGSGNPHLKYIKYVKVKLLRQVEVTVWPVNVRLYFCFVALGRFSLLR
jgi:hypothetical protein